MDHPFTSPVPTGGQAVISDSNPDTHPGGAPVAPIPLNLEDIESPPASGTGSSHENPPARAPAAPRPAISGFNPDICHLRVAATLFMNRQALSHVWA